MEQKKSGLLPIVGLILLIVVLFVGIKLIFAGLGAAMPKPETEWEWLTNQGGLETAYALRVLSEEERQAKDVARWLSAAEEQMAEGEQDQAFWLYRQEQDQYVLYLPGQDRALTSDSITATEEREEDGEYTLVLRARTPEESDDVTPEEQLLCFATQSESWRGIRVRVILDGREQAVYKLASQGDSLYSTEELYIGRF